MSNQKYFVFDVESIGLHGEGYAVGWVVVDATHKELDRGMTACVMADAQGSDSDRKWVENNIPLLPATVRNIRELREVFWAAWTQWKERGALMAADCGWPVETNLLSACVADDPQTRKWSGPYPFIEISTLLLSRGKDPLGTYPRLPGELPIHHPLADARQSARLLLEALHPRS